MSLSFHNTLSREIETFEPLAQDRVTLYTCGPTVYDYLTVGNWATYIRWDILVRTLLLSGYTVDRVMNITDVGHLVSDSDEGQDKLEKGAKREGKTAWEVADFYTEHFMVGIKQLNLLIPQFITRATEYIPQQLDLIRTLHEKGFTYVIDDGIYFDTAKFPTYGDFAHLNLDELKAGARVEFNPQKRSPSDFALWKFSPDDVKRDMEWDTPAGLLDGAEPQKGFPGWHLECSAMSMDHLGETLDIHTGGIDHIPVHHTNEIAQSEAATGKLFSRFWLHANFMTVNGKKIAKSLGNGFTLDDLTSKGYTPADLRMLVLQSHYRSEADFTWDSLDAAHARLTHWRQIAELRHQLYSGSEAAEEPSYAASRVLLEAMEQDLDTPSVLRLIDQEFSDIEGQELSDINQESLVGLLGYIDELLGLDLLTSTPDIDDESKTTIIERRHAREAGDYAKADALRKELDENGVLLRDSADKTIWYRS